MYLKSIEIQGFKSFANKIVLNFKEGITGIVGPNGSGKSNIADAVRWVLGEQKTKQLRSSNMQDVIFSGTENRKAVSFASVNITFDNSDRVLGMDADEVVVGRRIYRSGESAYLLNGSQCRLKDVQELFYDTGIGKEGYSIIGQGQIDKILSGKPEERREIFDEAAGIVKFRRRRDAARKKLEHEQENLTRVEDILAELESRVGPLKDQSEKAKEYLALRDRLRVLETNFFLKTKDNLGEGLDAVAKDLETAKTQQQTIQADLDNAGSRFDVITDEISAREAQISELNSKISAIDIEREKNEGDIKLLEEQISSVSSTGEQSNKRLDDLAKQIEKYTAEGQKYSDQMAKAQEELADIEGKRTELERYIRAVSASIEKAEADPGSAGAEVLHELIAEHMQRTGEDLSGEELKFTELIENIKKLEKKRDSATEKSKKWQVRIQAMQDDIDADMLELHRVRARKESLESIAERYEGYGQSIRRVMSQKMREHGIIGVVSDIIKVDKKYETAIETALGGSIQNIVVRDKDTAKRMIAYLKENRYGRATFLPLTDVVEPRNRPGRDVLSEPGVVGAADELVSVDSQFEIVAANLLGRTVVAENIDKAIALQRKYKHSLRIVTLGGELLQPGGSMTGGAFASKGNLLGRKREIEGLSEDIKEKEEALSAKREELEELRTAYTLTTEDIDSINEELSDYYIKQNTAQISAAHSVLEGARQRLSEETLRESELKQEFSFARENTQRTAEELIKLGNDKKELEEYYSDSRNVIAERNASIEAVKAANERLSKERDANAEMLSEATQDKDRLSAEQKENFDSREDMRKNLMDLEKEILRLQNRLEKGQTDLEERTEYLWTEYELTPLTAESLRDDTLPGERELKRQINLAKGNIRALGSVNVGAIEEYKAVGERYEFLSAQHEDVVKARDALLSVIDELNRGMSAQFRQNFGEIEKEFNRVFVELFGGGVANLKLSQTDDVLEAGILINAQPPGKKLVNMMQLSGGEKALTAIALLFAIQNLKPSPFCLLDEIEAALDDSNVDRFAKYLHKMTKNIQFILITHRRGTMEAAHSLYGITMQEKGVSTLVSVSLIEDKLDA